MSGSKVRQWVLTALDIGCAVRAVTRGDPGKRAIAPTVRKRGYYYPGRPADLFSQANLAQSFRTSKPQVKRIYGQPQIIAPKPFLPPPNMITRPPSLPPLYIQPPAPGRRR